MIGSTADSVGCCQLIGLACSLDGVTVCLLKRLQNIALCMAVSQASYEGASSTASGTQQQVSRCRPIHNLWRSRVEKNMFRVIITILAFSYKLCVAVALEASVRLSSLLLVIVFSTFRIVLIRSYKYIYTSNDVFSTNETLVLIFGPFFSKN